MKNIIISAIKEALDTVYIEELIAEKVAENIDWEEIICDIVNDFDLNALAREIIEDEIAPF